jgi:hypothetical protein
VARITLPTRHALNAPTTRSPARTVRSSAQYPGSGGQPGILPRGRRCSGRSSVPLSALSHQRQRAMRDGPSSTNEAAEGAVHTQVRRR